MIRSPHGPGLIVAVSLRVLYLIIQQVLGEHLGVAGGQGKWTGRILRFGHMGEVGYDEMADAFGIMGDVLSVDGDAAAAAGRAAYEASLAPVPAR